LEAQDYGLLRPEDPLLIRIGDGESTLKYTGPIDQDIFRSPSGIAYYEHFALERDKGKILISATVHDVNHNLVATIEKNHWRLERQGISDKNYSDDSLEIKDLQGRVIFQIRLLAKEVRLQWEWARSDTRTGASWRMVSTHWKRELRQCLSIQAKSFGESFQETTAND
jgi:hypothetical protein